MPSAIPSETVRTRDTAGIVDTLGTIGVFHPTPSGIVIDILDALDHTSTCPQHPAPRSRRVLQTPLNCSSLPWQYNYNCAFVPPPPSPLGDEALKTLGTLTIHASSLLTKHQASAGVMREVAAQLQAGGCG